MKRNWGTTGDRSAHQRSIGLPSLGVLYTTQYLGIGFITTGLVAILRAGGTSLDTLALLQFVGLVWPIKFLWAPVIDRFGSQRRGHYRSWLLVLQAGLVLCLLAMAPLTEPAEQFAAVITLCVGYVFLSATQDIAVDAIAVRMFSGGRRGDANGIQISASYLGNILGGGACVIIYDRYGWVPAVVLLAALTALGLVVVWRLREPQRADRLPSTRHAYRALFSVLRQPGCPQWTFAVVPLFYVGAGASYALITPALVDAGWSLTRIGVVTGIVAGVPAIAAGLVAGRLIALSGRSRVLILGAICLAVSTIALLPMLSGYVPTALTITAICLFLAAYTIANVVLYTVNMDYSRPANGGTDFTVLSSFALICSFVASSAGLTAAAWFGYPAVALASLALVAAGAFLGVRHQRRHPSPDTPTPEPAQIPVTA